MRTSLSINKNGYNFNILLEFNESFCHKVGTMSQLHLPPEDYLEVAEKVRTGEYFRESRYMFDLTVNDAMAERYLYLLITALATMIFLVSFFASRALYPLQTSVPFAFSASNITDELPRIKSLLNYKGEDASEALLTFLVKNYVTFRESYDINSFDRQLNGVKSQSSEDVYKTYQSQVDPRNPDSPLTLYQRHSRRKINVLNTKRLDDQDFGMEVVFEAVIESKTDVKKSLWQANIAFNYSGIEIDEETEKVKPFSFVVTDYRIKRLQDAR